MITIFKANEEHLEILVPLFDKYRIFYKQISNLDSAKKFLKERVANQESDIFIAAVNGTAVGFTQLYKTFSSVTMQASYILNDLYVEESYRKNGVGEALLSKAKEFCREQGFKGLALETAKDNSAQYLYEKLGWQKDTCVFHYFWPSDSWTNK